MIQLTRRLRPVAAVIAGAVSLALATAPASARTLKLHFFEKTTSFKVLAPDGKPFTGNGSGPPPAGAHFDSTSDLYLGNHKHHAKRFSASSHIACTTTGPGVARCDGQIAIGGSMLLVNNVILNFAQNGPLRITLSAGTGIYKHVHGNTVSTDVSKDSHDSDDVLTLTY